MDTEFLKSLDAVTREITDEIPFLEKNGNYTDAKKQINYILKTIELLKSGNGKKDIQLILSTILSSWNKIKFAFEDQKIIDRLIKEWQTGNNEIVETSLKGFLWFQPERPFSC